MQKWLAVILTCTATLMGFSQTASSNYQPGTIMAVVSHQNTPGEATDNIVRYDVSIKVGDVLYVVLYAPPNGANAVEYSPGLDLLVLVGTNTLTFNSKLSGTTAVPILRQEMLPASSRPDWSQIPGQYFSLKQRHLSEALNLTEDQRTKIKPILEQEAGEANQFLGDPVLSRKEQLERWEGVVQSSDEKIKPLLSPEQLQRLKELRREQKGDLKKLIEEKKVGKQG